MIDAFNAGRAWSSPDPAEPIVGGHDCPGGRLRPRGLPRRHLGPAAGGGGRIL